MRPNRDCADRQVGLPTNRKGKRAGLGGGEVVATSRSHLGNLLHSLKGTNRTFGDHVMSEKPRLLDNNAHLEGGAEYRHWPRSRYSGVPLFPNKMVVTVVSTLRGQGHSHLIFEWFAKEKTKKGWIDGVWKYERSVAEHRNHHLFHLVPERTEEEIRDGIEPDSSALSLKSCPGVVLYSQDEFDYFPRKSPSAYSSWMVELKSGLQARDEAYLSIYDAPDFNLVRFKGGFNCSKFTIEIAKRVHIDLYPFLDWLKLPVPPKWLVDQKNIVDTEAEMWRTRSL